MTTAEWRRLAVLCHDEEVWPLLAKYIEEQRSNVVSTMLHATDDRVMYQQQGRAIAYDALARLPEIVKNELER